MGQIRTVADLQRAARRLRERGVTDPEELVDQLLRGRSAEELRILFRVIWGSLSPSGQRRVLAEAFTERAP